MVALQDIKPRTHIQVEKKRYYCVSIYGILLKSYFQRKLVNLHFLTAQATTSGISLQMADTPSPLARGSTDFFSLK